MDLGLEGKRAVVAAASRGLGKAIALRLAAEGARVAICARDAQRLEETAEEIRKRTRAEALAVPADLTDPAQIRQFVGVARERFGGIDILVANAGGPPPGSFLEMSDERWQAAFELTLMSAVRLAREVIPGMIAQRWGRLIFSTSVSVKQPIADLVLSNSLRLAVIGLAKTLANELAPYNITVNSVCPGATATDRMKELINSQAKRQGISYEDAEESWLRDIPMRRLGEPGELADLVAFLASGRASYITGTAIQVDGGSIRFPL
ncbi:MAG: SDR family oxidoreductase [Candidatus Bipolaricaulia bacterium]